jgi:hypothetical protein
VTADGAKLVVGETPQLAAGHVQAKLGDLTATARLRVFPNLPWKFDFNEGGAPAGWINGVLLPPGEVDGEKVIKKSAGRGRPSYAAWMGPSTMTDYTIQADVRMTEESRRLPSIGITANRYDFIIKGNTLKLSIQSWPAHLRMAKEIRFRSDPDVWYTMKLQVDEQDDQAVVRGKVWKRDEAEPAEWTIEATDPHPNRHGSPGLYNYALATSFYDNVIVAPEAAE